MSKAATGTYSVGSQWLHHFGNGFMIGAITKKVDNLRVEFNKYGVVQKSWLKKYWWKL